MDQLVFSFSIVTPCMHTDLSIDRNMENPIPVPSSWSTIYLCRSIVNANNLYKCWATMTRCGDWSYQSQ